ncbi:MAG: hypothetical protein F6J93_15405 [Oscillatoria sp. SIO1A7]|nr:hypothetical protein [Oscillatoria sp. SIO1A7]
MGWVWGVWGVWEPPTAEGAATPTERGENFLRLFPPLPPFPPFPVLPHRPHTPNPTPHTLPMNLGEFGGGISIPTVEPFQLSL